MQADGFSASIDLFPEKELDRVGDSVYTAQVEKMIRTDADCRKSSAGNCSTICLHPTMTMPKTT